MNSTATRFAIIGGLIIGVINLLWLYVAYWVGLHTSGIAVFQIYMLLWLLLNTVFYILLLRNAKSVVSSFRFWTGVGVGSNAAVISALVAVLAQIGYFTVVNPEWPDYLADSARQFFEEQGLSSEELELKVEQTRLSTTVTNYAIQSFLSETLLGVILSMITMAFLRERSASDETSKVQS